MAIITIEEALQGRTHLFVDVRSEEEFEASHIPNAINLPILNNDDRKLVGTIYKTKGKHEAILTGIDRVKPKMQALYETFYKLSEEYDQLIIYCARGGMRSETILNFIKGFGLKNIKKLQGGYKSYRHHVLSYLDEVEKHHDFLVLQGRTGAGKTKVLTALSSIAYPVVDLEGLAKNAGSVFGTIPFNQATISQKQFENDLFDALYQKPRKVFIESESRRIGRVSLRGPFYDHLEASKHILLDTPMDQRIEHISEMYLERPDVVELEKKLSLLRKRLGHETVDALISALHDGQYEKVIAELMVKYYDPLYEKSMKRYKNDYTYQIKYDTLDKVIYTLQEIYERGTINE